MKYLVLVNDLTLVFYAKNKIKLYFFPKQHCVPNLASRVLLQGKF